MNCFPATGGMPRRKAATGAIPLSPRSSSSPGARISPRTAARSARGLARRAFTWSVSPGASEGTPPPMPAMRMTSMVRSRSRTRSRRALRSSAFGPASWARAGGPGSRRKHEKSHAAGANLMGTWYPVRGLYHGGGGVPWEGPGALGAWPSSWGGPSSAPRRRWGRRLRRSPGPRSPGWAGAPGSLESPSTGSSGPPTTRASPSGAGRKRSWWTPRRGASSGAPPGRTRGAPGSARGSPWRSIPPTARGVRPWGGTPPSGFSTGSPARRGTPGGSRPPTTSPGTPPGSPGPPTAPSWPWEATTASSRSATAAPGPSSTRGAPATPACRGWHGRPMGSGSPRAGRGSSSGPRRTPAATTGSCGSTRRRTGRNCSP